MILTPEQELIRDSMRAFAQERLAPFAAEWDRNHTFPREALNELAELGALGMVVPEEWGGAGMDYMSLVLTLEEIASLSAFLCTDAASGMTGQTIYVDAGVHAMD